MHPLTARQKLVVAHVILSVVVSVVFWLFLHTAIDHPGGREIGVAVLAASGLFAWMLVGFLLWKEPLALWIGLLSIVMPLFFWGRDGRLVVGVALVLFLLWISARSIQHELQERLIFSSARAFVVAKQSSVLGFSLLLSLGYFVSIQMLSWDDLTPRFRLGAGTIEQILTWVSRLDPALASLGKNHQTVDEYLRSFGAASSLETGNETQQFEALNDQIGRLQAQGITVAFSGDALASVRNAAESNALTSGRRQLGELAGRTVEGNESVSALFSEVVQKKLFTIVEGSRLRERIPDRVLPAFIALLFFLTIWPVGLMLFSVWSRMATVVIALFRKVRWIEIGKHPVVQERLEE